MQDGTKIFRYAFFFRPLQSVPLIDMNTLRALNHQFIHTVPIEIARRQSGNTNISVIDDDFLTDLILVIIHRFVNLRHPSQVTIGTFAGEFRSAVAVHIVSQYAGVGVCSVHIPVIDQLEVVVTGRFKDIDIAAAAGESDFHGSVTIKICYRFGAQIGIGDLLVINFLVLIVSGVFPDNQAIVGAEAVLRMDDFPAPILV